MNEHALIGGAVEWINAEKGYVVITPDDRNREFFIDLEALDETERGRAKAGGRVLVRSDAIRAEKSSIARGRVMKFDEGGRCAIVALPGETGSVHVDAQIIRRSGLRDLQVGDNVVVKFKNIQNALIAIDVSRPRVAKGRLQPFKSAAPALEAGTAFDRCLKSKDADFEASNSVDASTSEVAMQLLERIETALDDMSDSISAYFDDDSHERRDSDGLQ